MPPVSLPTLSDSSNLDSSESESSCCENRSDPPLQERRWIQTYKPLFLVVVYCAGGSLITLVNHSSPSWSLAMRVFMGLFFVVFSFLKMLDIAGFARAFGTYDVLAKRFPAYGFVYPFVELGLGITYLCQIAPLATNVATLLIMLVGAIGVVRAVRQRQSIRCACMGSLFDLPMSTVTVVENGTMAAMAAIMIGVAVV
ncbi:MAG: MauE/DoxX family redox-associated membrane protein [Planctomycetota bacterium]